MNTTTKHPPPVGAEVLTFDATRRRSPAPAGAPMECRRGRYRGDVVRPLYAVPGFLAAVREARAIRPELARASIVAAGRASSRASYLLGESLVSIIDQREHQAPARGAR